MRTVVILLGGNMGDVKSTFQTVIAAFQKAGYELFDHSSVYTSKAWGYESENLYYNQLIVLKTNNNPQDTLTDALRMENEHGRVRNRSNQYTDRGIDIDILFYDSEIVMDENLIIPHPRLHLRKFCLLPLMEIMPNFVHPGLDKPIGQLLDECGDKSIVQIDEK